MTNLNPNAYFALKIAEKGYASVTPVEKFSLCGGQSFTLSVQFYAEFVDNQKIILVRQEGSFELGIDNKAAYFEATGLGKFILPDNSYLISGKVWNTITVTFDTSIIKIYVNGVRVFERAAQSPSVILASNYEIGKNVNGYIRYVKLFESCLSDQEVIDNIFELPIFPEKMELFLDFSAPVPEDRGKNHKQILLNQKNVSKQAFQVLEDGKVKPKNSDEINKVIAEQDFTFMFNICPMLSEKLYDEAIRMLLFSNANEYENSRFIISLFPLKGETNTINLEVAYGNYYYTMLTIPLNKWSQVTVVYNRDSETMTAYLNGEKEASELYEIATTASEKEILIASRRGNPAIYYPLGGYMEYLGIFNRSLNDKDVQIYYNDSSLAMQDSSLLSMYACSDYKFIDTKKKTDVPISGDMVIKTSRSSNWCDPQSLAYALDAKGNGGALVSDSEELCNLINQDAFTLSSKVYVNEQYGLWSLLSCAQIDGDKKLGMELYVRRTSAGISLMAEVNGVTYENKKSLTGYAPSWVDVAVTYDRLNNGCFKLFINGENFDTLHEIFFNKFKATAIIGNNPLGKCAFNGYIGYFATFNSTLQENVLQEYMSNQPYIFAPNIKSLYCFYQNTAFEQINKIPIEFIGDAGIVLSFGTQSELPAPYKPYVPACKPSETSQWQANVIVDFYTEIYLQMFGIKPTFGVIDPEAEQKTASPEFVMLYDNYLYDMPEVENVVNSYQDVSKGAFDAFLGTLVIGGMAVGIGCFFAFGGGQSTFAVTSAPAIAGSANAATKATEAVEEFMDDVCKKSKKKASRREHPPIPVQPDDPQEKYQIVSIESIDFPTDNDGKKAVKIKNYTGSGDILFISSTVDKDTAYLEVKCKYKTNSDTPYTIRLRGKSMGDKVLGDLDEVSKTLTSSGIYTLKFYLKHNTMKNTILGKLSNPINWLNNGKIMQTTEHQVHLLAQKPVAPWDIEKEETSPTLNALKTCGKIVSHCTDTKASTLDYIAAATTKWLHGGNLFSASKDGKAKYSGYDSDQQLCFKRDSFDNRVNSSEIGKIEMNSLDCSLAIGDTARLQGFDGLSVTNLVSGFEIPTLEVDAAQNPALIIQTGQARIPLDMQSVQKIGDLTSHAPEDLVNHFVATKCGSFLTDYLVYDGYFKPSTSFFINKKFTDMESDFVLSQNPSFYRESICKDASCCVLDAVYDDWSHAEGVSLQLNIRPRGFGIEGNQIVIDGQRGRFESALIGQFHTNTALCHSISSHTIQCRILYPVNLFIEGSFTNEECRGYLDNLKLALYAGNLAQITNKYNEGVLGGIDTVIDKIVEIRDPSNKIDVLCQLCNKLYKFMFNVRFNLRAGNSSWNSSVQDAFDPEEWCYVEIKNAAAWVTSHHGNILCEQSIPCEDFELMENKTAPESNGFYLTNPRDAIRLRHMLETKGYTDDGFAFYGAKSGEYKFLYSSSNKNKLIPTNASNKFKGNIFYYQDEAWENFK